MNTTESQIKLAQGGDLSALDDVFGEAIDFLTSFIGTHVQSIADRDDVVQRTVMALYKNFGKFNCGMSFENWVAGFAWRNINRYYKRGWDDKISTNREVPFTDWLGDTEYDDIEGAIDPDRVIS